MAFDALDSGQLLAAVHVLSTMSHLAMSAYYLREARPPPPLGWYALVTLSLSAGVLWLDRHHASASEVWPWLYLVGLILSWAALEWRLGLWGGAPTKDDVYVNETGGQDGRGATEHDRG